ncbi:sensor histidine kinase [uncultured Pseudoteredinibacter sp.]|uniref:sensor histidine kinase n=1 Tax=uncultured Pseudoteredinibacter sp. TaxID=1641701 RepID=UPI002608B35C|nr:sensor histidine kinase [uncultured Pseudoteredinibacter sp.]
MKLFLLRLFCSWFLVAEMSRAGDIFDLGDRHFQSVSLNGARSSVITSIAQGPDGLIWKGSQWGLFYFDGYNYLRPEGYKQRFKSYNRQYIKRIWFSRAGDLFAGTAAAGLIYWDVSSNEWLAFNIEEASLPKACSGRISAFADSSAGAVWVGTDSGLCLFDPRSRTFSAVKLALLPQRFFRSLWLEGDRLWFGTQNEFGFIPEKALIEALKSNADSPGIELLIDDISVSSIRSDSDGVIWVSGENTAVYGVYPDGQVKPLAGSLATAELAVTEDELWLASYSKGLQVYDRRTAEFIESFRHDSNVASTLDNDELESILYDQSGILWVGTRGHGFNTIVPSQKSFRLLFPSPEKANSLSVANIHIVKVMADGEVWFGSTSNGVDVFDQKKGLIRSYRHQAGVKGALQGPHILSIDQEADGTIWLASQSNGVFRYLKDSDSFEHYFEQDGVLGGRLRHVFFRSNGDVLVAGERGVVVKKQGSESFAPLMMEEENSPLQYSILNIYERQNGDVWLNGMDRQYFLAANSSKAKQLSLSLLDDSPLPQGSTLGIRDSKSGQFYMYKGGKLLRLASVVEADRAIFELVLDESYGKLDHFEDDQGVWWAYGQWANTNTWEQGRFGEADGMPMTSGWIFSLDKTAKDTYLYGSPYGVVMLKASRYKHWVYQPPVNISSYTIDGKRIDGSTKKFSFPAHSKSLSFEFSALDYSFPKSNRYAYRLLGYDENWTEVDYKNRRATYTNLSPGEYQFQVRGSNRHGLWSNEQAVIAFKVMPKWYQTWWFALLALISIVCLLLLVYRWRVKQLRRKQQELEGLVSYRTQELEASLSELQSTQKKLLVSEKMASLGRLVRGVAHEINTPLGVIKMAASSLREQAEVLHSNASNSIQQQTGKPLATSFEMIGKNIDRIGGLVSTFKELAPDENVSVIKKFELDALIDSSLRSLDERLQGVHCRTTGESGLNIVSNSNIVHQVLQEIIENALCHAWAKDWAHSNHFEQAQLHISWGVSVSDEHSVFISVEDNGRGISEVDRAKIFDPFYTLHDSADTSGLGLHVAYLKVSQQLFGELRCENAASGGCCFTMILPIDPEAAIGETTG